MPKSTILSCRTGSLSSFLSASRLFDADASAGLQLATILLNEFLQGYNGPWWGYLQSLPRQRQRTNGQLHWGLPLPLNWSKSSPEWQWIQHAETGRMVKRVEDDPQGRIEGIGMSLVR